MENKPEYLDEKLEAYAASDMYPFHMPGHKRRSIGALQPYAVDITEIDGFDNLHGAAGILREAQKRAAALYQAKKSYYLVNGSTCGLLAAIGACCGKRKNILVARNCHKAVYHAIELFELSADYVYPVFTQCGICGQITPQSVEAAVKKAAGEGRTYEALLVTSPTYDGVVSDIRGLAEAAHRHGMTFIVDEAHGAHLGLSPYFPKSAATRGADLVIQSMHKTLPSFTQTALLHMCSDRVAAEKIEKQLAIFETSSPSYLLMAGMERCIRLLADERETLFKEYWNRLSEFYRKTAELKRLRVATAQSFLEGEIYEYDSSKVLIFTGTDDYSGRKLYDCLRQQYRLQPEMAAGDYVLAMTGIMDTEEGFSRLISALFEIDRQLSARRLLREGGNGASHVRAEELYGIAETVVTIAEADAYGKREMPLDAAEGCVSGGYVYLYPPGIPLLAPGERITGRTVAAIKDCARRGLDVAGVAAGKMCTLVI